MTLRAESPHVIAVRKDGSVWMLPEAAHESFCAEWMAGRAFWIGVDLWDAPITIKLGDITGVIHKTAHTLEIIDDEEEEERTRAVIEGAE